MSAEDFLPILREQGLITHDEVFVHPLAGGVSGDIVLLEQGSRRMVIKQALPKLKVQAEWFADVSRNRHEQAYLRYVGRSFPSWVPRVLYCDDEHAFFVMEHLGEGFENWKALLLHGQIGHGAQAGQMLGAIHALSWEDAEAREKFATRANFYQLRTDPYLLSTGARYPGLRHLFEEEAQRLEGTEICLVHGDFSPKNILLRGERMVLLDCEVAWFGDPAFDVAFLTNHLFLKSLFHAPHPASQTCQQEVLSFWTAYESALGPEKAQAMEIRVARLLLLLMLARVDGKSPAEYLTRESQRQFIRRFVTERLTHPVASVAEVQKDWAKALAHHRP